MAKEVKKEQAAKNAKQSKGEAKSKKGGEQVVPKGWIPNLQKEYKERIAGELDTYILQVTGVVVLVRAAMLYAGKTATERARPAQCRRQAETESGD